MIEELLTPLERIIAAADELLTNTVLDDELHRKFIHSIFTHATEMRDLLITIPDLTWHKARELLSFETRSHLASIIGYAEVMLEEEEGYLSDPQRELLRLIRSAGKQILKRLTFLSGETGE